MHNLPFATAVWTQKHALYLPQMEGTCMPSPSHVQGVCTCAHSLSHPKQELSALSSPSYMGLIYIACHLLTRGWEQMLPCAPPTVGLRMPSSSPMVVEPASHAFSHGEVRKFILYDHPLPHSEVVHMP